MRLELSRMVTMAFMVFAFSACSTSTGTYNTPIGTIQLGMHIEDIRDILGEGTVVEPLEERGVYTLETRAYPARDGRSYVVYFVNDIVRRWELKERVPTASTSESQ